MWPRFFDSIFVNFRVYINKCFREQLKEKTLFVFELNLINFFM